MIREAERETERRKTSAFTKSPTLEKQRTRTDTVVQTKF